MGVWRIRLEEGVSVRQEQGQGVNVKMEENKSLSFLETGIDNNRVKRSIHICYRYSSSQAGV